jgi:hypothetical protein
MKKFIGVKHVRAIGMNLIDYEKMRGFNKKDEVSNADGYLVEYLHGGKPNVDGHEGYVSWSPKDVFERAYRPVDGMSFGLAIEAMRKGLKVARTRWNGKGMWLSLVKNTEYTVSETDDSVLLPWIGMKTHDNKFIPWLASQSDMLSDDWMVVE